MKFAIISDIHGNFEALQTVINHALSKGVDQFLCLGDIVGYGPDPRKCVDLVRSLQCPVVQGNHDQFASTDIPLTGCNPIAIESLEWTRQQLTPEQKTWLRNLPATSVIGNFVITHANLIEPERFAYVHDEEDAEICLLEQDFALCFIGHTHVPAVFVHGEGVTPSEEENSYSIKPGTKTLVNVGAVGQPRDGDSRASYAIYDADSEAFSFQRVEYAIGITQKRLRNTGLPEDLASRLIDAA